MSFTRSHLRFARVGNAPQVHNCSGFTLIEVMLVVVIIGVMAGMATLAIGGNESRLLQQEASRLQQRLLLAQDEATFTQADLGLHFTETGYQFLKYDHVDNVWQPLSTQDSSKTQNAKYAKTLGSYEYELPVTVHLELEGTRLKLLNQPTSSDLALDKKEETLDKKEEALDRKELPLDKKEETPEPELLLLANGESSAFTLTLAMEDDHRLTQTLHTDGFSPIERTAASSDSMRSNSN